MKVRLAAYVAEHGPIQTSSELLQKCADFARELDKKKRTPDDSTIRDAIKTHALNVAAGSVPGKSRSISPDYTFFPAGVFGIPIVIGRRNARGRARTTPAPGHGEIMKAKKKISEAEQQRRDRQRAMSIAEFCERYGPGRTKAYEELKSGRLRGRK